MFFSADKLAVQRAEQSQARLGKCFAVQSSQTIKAGGQYSVRDDIEGFSEQQVRHNKLCRKQVGSRHIIVTQGAISLSEFMSS